MTGAVDRRAATGSLLAPGYRGTTVGAVALVFLAAFEALAVATVMPVVTADLGAEDWYAVAFSATLGAGVVGMVLTGAWVDRSGPARPLLSAVGVFALGLLVCGTAGGVVALVAGRFLQGLGGGGLSVALYVLVGRVYAPADRPRMLGLLAAAWVLPGLVGPYLAGTVAESVGWRWVFLGVVVIAAVAVSLLVPGLRTVRPEGGADRGRGRSRDGLRRAALAVAVAGSVVALNLTAGLDGPPAVALALAALVAAALAVRPLLPRGTLRAASGLPAVVATRGLIAATFFACEVFLPYLLQEQYDVSVSRSGLVLTAATLGWAAASHVQGRLGARLSDARALRIGSAIEVAGVATVVLAVAVGLPPAAVVAGWFLTATGMGTAYPRTTAAMLTLSPPAQHGQHSAALTIADSLGAATAIAVVGIVFAAAGSAADPDAFAAALACALALGAAAVLVARRA